MNSLTILLLSGFTFFAACTAIEHAVRKVIKQYRAFSSSLEREADGYGRKEN